MVKRRVYDDQNYIHFVTFSCYKRRKFLNTDRARRIVVGHLGSRLSKQNGLCLGFVIMPDHVHALVWFPETQQLSKFMNKWKDQTSCQLKELFQNEYPKYWSQVEDSDPIWQARYYGLNIWSRKKVEEKLDYMHLNPVRAGLAEQICDWLWSSARWYQEQRSVGLKICWPPGIDNDDDFNTL